MRRGGAVWRIRWWLNRVVSSACGPSRPGAALSLPMRHTDRSATRIQWGPRGFLPSLPHWRGVRLSSRSAGRRLRATEARVGGARDRDLGRSSVKWVARINTL